MGADIIKFSSWLEGRRRRRLRLRPAKAGMPRLTASVRALRELAKEADHLACQMLWLGQIAKRGHDPRALIALTDEMFEDYFDEIDASAEFVTAFAAAWRRHLMRRRKPRPVE